MHAASSLLHTVRGSYSRQSALSALSALSAQHGATRRKRAQHGAKGRKLRKLRKRAQKGATRRNSAQLGATRRIHIEQKYHMDNGLEFNAKHIISFYKKYQYLVLPDVERWPEYLRGLKSSRASKTPHVPVVRCFVFFVRTAMAKNKPDQTCTVKS
jgi:hypothetical protein